jgi:hypothetical protein
MNAIVELIEENVAQGNRAEQVEEDVELTEAAQSMIQMEPIVELAEEDVTIISKKLDRTNEMMDARVQEDVELLAQLALSQMEMITKEWQEDPHLLRQCHEHMESVIKTTIIKAKESEQRRLTMRLMDAEEFQQKLRVQHESMTRLMSMHVNTRADYYQERMAHKETKEKLRLSRNRNAEFRRRYETVHGAFRELEGTL